MARRIGGMVAAGVASALALASPGARAEDPGLLAVGAGAYNVLHKDRAAQLRVEYRFPQRLFLFKPLLGVLATNDRTVYAYGGLRVDVNLGEHFVIMPVATVGYWDRGGGKNLGAHTEFKTGAEFAYRFSDASRLGIAFDHISNAGITRQNPGTESVLLVYSIPFGWVK